LGFFASGSKCIRVRLKALFAALPPVPYARNTLFQSPYFIVPMAQADIFYHVLAIELFDAELRV